MRLGLTDWDGPDGGPDDTTRGPVPDASRRSWEANGTDEWDESLRIRIMGEFGPGSGGTAYRRRDERLGRVEAVKLPQHADIVPA